MKKIRMISKVAISASLKPTAITSSTESYSVSNDLPLNHRTSNITKIIFISIAVLCFLVIPKEVLAFDFGSVLNNVVKSIEKNIPGKSNKNSNTAEKKVDEMMNHDFGKPSATPQHGAAEKEVYQQKKLANREVQQRLNSLGYNVGAADGVLGPKSVKAIKAFQRDHGMAQTGRVSPGLLATLKSANNRPLSKQQVVKEPGPAPGNSSSIDWARLEPPAKGDLYRLAMAEYPDLYNTKSFVNIYREYVDPPPWKKCNELDTIKKNPFSEKREFVRWQKKMQAAFKAAPSWPKQQIFRFDSPAGLTFTYDSKKHGIVVKTVNFDYDSKKYGIVMYSPYNLSSGNTNNKRIEECHTSFDDATVGMMDFDNNPLTHGLLVSFLYINSDVNPWLGATSATYQLPIEFFIPMASDKAEQFFNRINGTSGGASSITIEMAGLVGPIKVEAGSAFASVKVVAARLVHKKGLPQGKWKYDFIYPIPVPSMGTKKKSAIAEVRQTGGMSANSGPVQFTGLYNGLLGFKFLPKLYFSDESLSYLTQQQIRWESEEWTTIDSEKVIHKRFSKKIIATRPTFTFSWADSKKDARLKTIYIRYFLGKDLDWSFLKDYSYDPRKKSIVQLFLFQRKKYQNRMPEFAAADLSPVYKDFVKTLLPLIPTAYVVRDPIQLTYDMNRQEMSFGGNEIMKELKANFAFGKNRRSGMVFPLSLKEKKIYFSPTYNSLQPKTPTSMPGMLGGRYEESGPAGRWRKDIASNGSSAAKVDMPEFLAFDRDLKLAPAHIMRSEAEKILSAQQKGPLSAELYFKITGAKPVDYFINGKLNKKFSVLLGKVNELRIVDAAGNEVLNVPLKTVQAIESERKKKQAEVEAQAQQKEAKAQANQQAVADMQAACWNEHTFGEVSECLNDMPHKISREVRGNRKVWIALGKGTRYAQILRFTAEHVDQQVKSDCHFGVYKAYKGVRDYSTIQQKTNACIDAVTPAMKKEEDTCLAVNRPPLALKEGIGAIQKCMRKHAQVSVNKYYGLDSNH